MLPCQKTCPSYREGCHKTCANWQARQGALREERQRKRAYLDYYNELCRTVVRQCRAMCPSRGY